MDYVFGSTLVCEDAETAKRVTFDPAVRLKSVTLEGDVYDPAGTLSGGSAPNSSGVLVTLQELNRVKQQLSVEGRTLAEVQATIEGEQTKLDKARKVKQELELKTHEIKLAEEQIGGNSSSSVGLVSRATTVKMLMMSRPRSSKRSRRRRPASCS